MTLKKEQIGLRELLYIYTTDVLTGTNEPVFTASFEPHQEGTEDHNENCTLLLLSVKSSWTLVFVISSVYSDPTKYQMEKYDGVCTRYPIWLGGGHARAE